MKSGQWFQRRRLLKLLTDDARRTTTHDGRRTTDIQGITKAHPEHSSGELKTTILSNLINEILDIHEIKTVNLINPELA